ncbi:MAG TPA: glycosyltransferase family 4 protein, partial [Candidatus Binatia bacterium]|nr:glycosyltransferase family 4 protein [Candidatus Binatia bacterium]
TEMGVQSDIMTYNMDVKWTPRWKEEIIEGSSAKLLREPGFNPLLGLPNPMSNLLKLNLLPSPLFLNRFRNYDIIHFVGEADLSFPLFSFMIRKPKLLQCVGIFRKGGIYKYYMHDRPSLGAIFTRVFKRLSNKFVISSSEERLLLSEMGIPKEEIVVLPIGVDTRTFRPDLANKSKDLVLFVGRIHPIKGLDVLLRALPHVRRPVHLIVLGSSWDKAYIKEIERLSNGINQIGFHKVTLVGEVKSNDLVPWYQKAAILVCPYLYETSSNVVRESMACGTPVVSTGSHVLEDRPDGILLSRRIPEELAKTISEILENQELRARLGEEARNAAVACLSWDYIITNLIKIYREMLPSSNSSVSLEN